MTVEAPRRARRLLVGRPMQTDQLEETLLPNWLALPHFGAVENAAEHLDAATQVVRRHADLATSVDCDTYVRTVRDELSAKLEPDGVDAYALTMDLPQNHAGLRRWAEQRG